MIPGLEILNLHAQGGMAEVYRARGKGSDGRTWMYAVKRILPEFTADIELRKMFVEEARIASQLIHPNIVRVYDLARSEHDEFFIVMEFLEGRDVADAIERHGAARRGGLPIWLAIHLAREVLAALAYATTQARDKQGRLLGLIHRDVSPHNIFVGFDGQVKLMDFGVAKVEQSSVRTQVGVTKGKFGYMSPEQLMSTGLDFRSDLYNVGILLFEVITCKRLFFGENPSQFLQAMMRGDVPPIDSSFGVPADLEALIRRALSRDRDDRPATAAAFDAELSALQQKHQLGVTRAHVANEWRRMFGADSNKDEAPPAHAPRRLASASAALPEVVARAQVPTVKPRPTSDGGRLPPRAPVATGSARAYRPMERTDDEIDRPKPPRSGSNSHSRSRQRVVAKGAGPNAIALGDDPWSSEGPAAREGREPADRHVVPRGSRVVALGDDKPKTDR